MTLARFLPAYPLLHTKIESSPREVTTETTDTVLSGPVADWHWKVLLTRTNPLQRLCPYFGVPALEAKRGMCHCLPADHRSAPRARRRRPNLAPPCCLQLFASRLSPASPAAVQQYAVYLIAIQESRNL